MNYLKESKRDRDNLFMSINPVLFNKFYYTNSTYPLSTKYFGKIGVFFNF